MSNDETERIDLEPSKDELLQVIIDEIERAETDGEIERANLLFDIKRAFANGDLSKKATYCMILGRPNSEGREWLESLE